MSVCDHKFSHLFISHLHFLHIFLRAQNHWDTFQNIYVDMKIEKINKWMRFRYAFDYDKNHYIIIFHRTHTYLHEYFFGKQVAEKVRFISIDDDVFIAAVLIIIDSNTNSGYQSNFVIGITFSKKDTRQTKTRKRFRWETKSNLFSTFFFFSQLVVLVYREDSKRWSDSANIDICGMMTTNWEAGKGRKPTLKFELNLANVISSARKREYRSEQ